jgi:hypothetical protein
VRHDRGVRRGRGGARKMMRKVFEANCAKMYENTQ